MLSKLLTKNFKYLKKKKEAGTYGVMMCGERPYCQLAAHHLLVNTVLSYFNLQLKKKTIKIIIYSQN